jgi:hypothetical protein
MVIGTAAISAYEAVALFSRARPEALEQVEVDGDLDLSGLSMAFLPRRRLVVAGSLTLRDAPWLNELPPETVVLTRLDVSGSTITKLCELRVGEGIAARRCRKLREVEHLALGPFTDDDEFLLRRDDEDDADPARPRLARELPFCSSTPFVDLTGCDALEALVLMDDGLGTVVDLTGCDRIDGRRSYLIGDFRVRIPGRVAPRWLTEVTFSGALEIRSLEVRELGDLEVRGDLSVEGCRALRRLGFSSLEVAGTLTLTGCDALERLPSGTRVGRIVARLAGEPPLWLARLSQNGTVSRGWRPLAQLIS